MLSVRRSDLDWHKSGQASVAVQRCFEEPAGTSFQPGWNDDDGDSDDGDGGDDGNNDNNTIKAGGSTKHAQNVGWSG